MSRRETERTCPDCAAVVLTGLDSDVVAITVTIDPTRLDKLGEAIALLQGRTTYAARLTTNDRGRPISRYLERRTPSGISSGLRLFPTFAEHRCHQPLPESAEQTNGWATGTEF